MGTDQARYRFAHLIADEAAKGRLLAEIAEAQGKVGDVTPSIPGAPLLLLAIW
jgi:hypothetical protein